MGGPLFLRASAGSGKTYRLVLEYLRLLLQQPINYKSILAVTFTNDATAEMKTRILLELEKLKKQDPHSMATHLAGIGNEKFLADKASQALDLILHDYSHFAIMTIDSFFQMVLRSFARELRLPLGYAVELDNEAVLAFSIQSLLSKIGTEQKLTDWLCEYARANLNEGKTWNIEGQVGAISKELFKEISRHREWEQEEDVQEKLAVLQTALRKTSAVFEKKMSGLSASGMDLLERFGIEAADVSGGYLLKYLRDIPAGKYVPNATLTKSLRGDEPLWKKSATTPVKEKIQACLDNGLQAVIDQITLLLERDLMAYNSACQASRHIYNLGILDWIQQYIRVYRKEENTLMISDTLLLLESLICGENTPFVYEKIGVRFKHVLIDEFQDTSGLQWNNLLPLLLHLLSQGGTVLIVGDAKQSIYRWRGGDMNLLLQKAPLDLDLFLPTHDSLDVNYRSRENIITFNNHFFRWLAGYMDAACRGKLCRIYEAFEQSLPEKNKPIGGYAEVRFFPNEKSQEDSAKSLALQALPGLVNEVCSRGYRRGDICMLVRENALAQEVAAYLVEAGIPVVTPQSLMLENDMRIKLLVAAMRLVTDTSLSLNKVTFALHFAVVHDLPLSEEMIFRLELPEAAVEISDFFKIADALRPLPLGELNEYLVNHLLAGTEADAFLLAWQDRIQQYISDGSAHTATFLEWWDEYAEKISVDIPGSPDAVKLMTIHKSKGLQFGVVILPFVHWSLGPSKEQLLWVNAEEEPYNAVPYLPVSCIKALETTFFEEDYAEERAATLVDNINLLYVACTRAVDELYVYCPAQQMEDKHTGTDLSNAGQLFSMAFSGNCHIPSGVLEEDAFSLGKTTLHVQEEIPVIPAVVPAYFSTPVKDKVSLKSFRVEEDTQTGKTWHKLLADVAEHGAILPVVKSFFSSYPGLGLGETEITGKLEKILALERSFLPGGSYTLLAERNLLWQGEFLRPDKVYLCGNRAVIVDYKTGNTKNTAEHQRQMQNYRLALKDCGYIIEGAYLVYTDTLVVVPVFPS